MFQPRWKHESCLSGTQKKFGRISKPLTAQGVKDRTIYSLSSGLEAKNALPAASVVLSLLQMTRADLSKKTPGVHPARRFELRIALARFVLD